MNKILIVLAVIFLTNCKQNKASDEASNQHLSNEVNPVAFIPSDTTILSIDTKKSIVEWKGTKFRGTGKHEGTVNFKEGELRFFNDQLIGGHFVVDMQSIYNTDIPKSDPEPRINLTRHLNSDFKTSVFPTASFQITEIKPINVKEWLLKGDMTIIGNKHSISVRLNEIQKSKKYSSEFTLDRLVWKIGENGTWLEQKLVDAEFFLKVKIETF